MIALLGLLTLLAPAATGSVTLAWDANSEPNVTAYAVQYGISQGGPYTEELRVGAIEMPHATVQGLPVGATYYFVIRAIDDRGIMSPKSNEVNLPLTGQNTDDCAPITGRYNVSVTTTVITRTGSGGPGSVSRAQFQLASPNAPITRVVLALNGSPISQGGCTGDADCGVDLAAFTGMKFTMPAPGTYVASITAYNNKGCSRAANYASQLVVQ